MVKKILAVLSLFIFVGCSNGVKKVKVENFDYQKTKLVSYVDDTHNQQIDHAYNVANKHFEYVKNDTGSCSVFNKVSEAPGEEIYLAENYGDRGGTLLGVDVYQKQNGNCVKMQSLKNIQALSIKQVSYHNKLYVNIISGEDEINKSGLWVIDGQNKKLISKFKSMAADFDIDRATGNLYTIEYPEDGKAYFREYNQDDKIINEYVINDEDYAKLFIKDGKIGLVSSKSIGEQDGGELFNYVVTMVPINNFFEDIKNKKYEDVIELETKSDGFTTIEVQGDYIAFYGGDSVACQLSNWKCFKYEANSAELFGGQGYIGISRNGDDGMYLNKFGTYDMEKLLDDAQSYFTRQDGKDIYFQVFDSNSPANSYNKTKTIKYTIK